SQRVEIAPRVGPAMHFEEFGRDVINGPEDIPGAGKLRGITGDTRDAKIGQITAPFFVKQHIRGFDIAVDNSLRVNIVERIPDILQTLADFCKAQRSTPNT